MDEPNYLQPGFDPTTLKVADLRGILLEHDIDYPSSAKKAQLVDLFIQHVAPKARRILNARSRVKASGRGIIDADRDSTPPVEATPRRRSSRRTTRMGTLDPEDNEEDDERRSESVAPPRRSASVKRASGKHTRVTETDKSEVEDQEPPKSIRKTRRSVPRQSIIPKPESPGLPPPALKYEDTSEETDEPIFSSHNPFQSGSSPAKSPDRTDRRKTIQSIPSEKRRKSISARRRTDFSVVGRGNDQDYGYTPTSTHVVPSSKNFEIPISRLPAYQNDGTSSAVVKKEEDEAENYTLEPGEEFTPDEAAEVGRQRAPLMRRRQGGQTVAGTSVLWVIVCAILSAYFMWWRKEKMEVGYCGYGKFDMQAFDPDWTSLIRPQCEPCPPNAICKPNYEAECKDDYVLVPNPLSFGGLIPLPPTCEPDSEKLRRIAILSDEAIRVLRERAADVECGEASGKDEEGVSEADLRQVLYDLKAPSLSDAQFSELWRNALEDVSNREEVVYHQDSHNVTYLRSTSLASVPLGCAIRKSIAGSVARYRIQLGGMILFVASLYYLRTTIASKHIYQTTVTKLVHIALQHLARHAAENPTEPWIGTVQLRDQVLQHEFNPERRRKLWDGVQKIVEANSNVRAGEREISGEIMRVWTWIGGRVSTARLGDLGGVVKEGDGDRWSEYPRVIA